MSYVDSHHGYTQARDLEMFTNPRPHFDGFSKLHSLNNYNVYEYDES